MARFGYTAIDKMGEKVSGFLIAPTIGTAHLQVIGLGLQPLKVEQKRSVLQFEVTKKKVKRDIVMHFSRQLGVFIRAGIPILDAMTIIRDDSVDKLFKKALEEIIDALRAGDSFSMAAREHPEAFPPYYTGMLSSAELAGNLDTVLIQLADYMERDAEARSKVVSAMIYPAVVFGMAIVTVVILAAFVLPRFKVFFQSLDAKLPLVTRMLISATSFFQARWPILLAAIVVIVLGFAITLRSKRGRLLLDTVLLRLPIAGDLAQHVLVERICRILASMVEAGVPLPDAMSVTSESISNGVYKSGLDQIRGEMLQGRGLAEPIAAAGILPTAARQMIRVGEETGTLEDQLQVAALYYQRELDIKIKRFTSLFEPAVIIFMGVVVGFVAVALISAMYGIYRQVKIG